MNERVHTSDAPLQVLLVEDSLDDAELLRLELADAGIACRIVRVDTPAALDAALRSDAPIDAILSDWTVPRMNGRQTLALAAALRPGTPFALLCGAVPPDADYPAFAEAVDATFLKDALGDCVAWLAALPRRR